jgi:hypothetical protein
MLIPKLRLHTEKLGDGQVRNILKYYVWETDTEEYIETRSLGYYDSEAECQEAIDFYNCLSVVNVS